MYRKLKRKRGKKQIAAMQKKLRFKEKEKFIKPLVVRGTFNQGDHVMFSDLSAGRQCTCNTLMALCHNVIHPCKSWSSQTINEILIEGDNIFRETVVGVSTSSRLMEINELPHDVTVMESKFKINYQPPITGLVSGNMMDMPNANDGVLFPFCSLTEALRRVEIDQLPSFLTIRDYTMCIMPKGKSISFFDSHSRDENGMCVPDGSAIVIHFENIDQLYKYLLELFKSLSINSDDQFDIVQAQITLLNVCDQPFIVVNKDLESTSMPVVHNKILIAIPREFTEFTLKQQEDLRIISSSRVSSGDVAREQIPESPERMFGQISFDESDFSVLQCDDISKTPKKTPRKNQNSRRFHSPRDITPIRKERARKSLEIRQEKARENIVTCNRKISLTGAKGLAEKTIKRSLTGAKGLAEKTIKKFHKDVRSSPNYICTCCHRFLYKKGVVKITLRNCSKIPDIIRDRCITGCQSVDEKEWICHTCKGGLQKGKIPAQAVCNKMEVKDVPYTLAILSSLEARLLATRYPFMKILALPRGKQNAIKGAVVNVPIDAKVVCNSLPHTPHTAGIIPLKLKRKMQYKSSVSYQNIRPKAVREAFSLLKKINKFYTFLLERDNWEKDCLEEDEMVWKELTGAGDKDCLEEDGMVSTKVADVENNTIAKKHGKDTNSSDTNKQDQRNEEEEEIDGVCQLRGVTYDTCLQESDFNTNCKDDLSFSIAPGEGQRPLPIMADESCEERAFPQLFPTGEFGFDVSREVYLSPKKYFNSRILNKDSRFAQNIEYLFFGQYLTEHKQVYESLSIAVRKAHSRGNENINASFVRNTNKLKHIILKDEAYKFLQPVRGSSPYWQRVMYDLMTAIKQLGIFTWFLTLSSADLSWPDMIQSIAKQYGEILSDEDVINLTWEERCNWLRRNPVTAARHFDFRLTTLFKDVIMNKDLLPIGHITNYFYRIEFQQRGSPHAHCVLFVQGAPKLSTHKVEVVQSFIDKFVTCEYPEKDDKLKELVNLQKHVHSPSCRKDGTNCRFKFPRPPSVNTLITKSDDEEKMPLKKASDILTRVHESLKQDTSENLSVLDILFKSGVDLATYDEALRSASNSRSVILRRSRKELNVNQYNETILKAWKANIDLQYVVDPYACIHYIVSYVTKAEKEMGQVLKAAAEELNDADTMAKMRNCARKCLQVRELSAQEAVYRLLGMSLHQATFLTVFVPTDFKENRIKLVKPSKSLEHLEDEDEDVFCKSIVDRYEARPQKLESMCLAEFASLYRICNSKKEKEEEEDPEDMNLNTESKKSLKLHRITLLNGLGLMRCRLKPALIRYYNPSEVKDPEKYYHHKLILYIPFRNEVTDLLGGYTSYAESYQNLEDSVKAAKDRLERLSDDINEALELFEANGPPTHAWDTLVPQTEQERSDLQNLPTTEDEEHLIIQPDDTLNLQNISAEKFLGEHVIIRSEPRSNVVDDETFREQVRSLNTCQRSVFNYILEWSRNFLKGRKKGTRPDPFHIFMTGGAGTGKSHVIKTIYQLLKKQLSLPGDNPDDEVVLLTAPTGTAAFQINGSTLHSEFLLPLSQTKSDKKLSDGKLNSLRCKFRNLQVLIIDEISMVGPDILLSIHRRLCEIKGTDNKAFGSICVFAIGDLYQLPPVCQPQVFELPTLQMDKFMGSLWDDFLVVELKDIMRQRDDVSFAEMLNRIRIGQATHDDIALLKTRLVFDNNLIYPRNALHVFATNKKVNSHNDMMMTELGCEIKNIKAKDKIPHLLSGYTPKDDERFTGGLPNILRIAIGARVMLTRNIDVTDGLVNGSIGIVVGFKECAEHVIEILVKFDSSRVGMKAREANSTFEGVVPIVRYEAKFTISKQSTQEIKRCQFPLRLAWAVTIHKVQGATVKELVVSFANRFTSGQAYVALSRATSLNGLFFLDFDPDKIIASKKVCQQMSFMLSKKKLLQEKERDTEDIFTFVLHNIRSLRRHMVDLRSDPIFENADVVILTETWLNELDRSSTYCLNGYTLIRCDRREVSKTRGGGVAAYVKSTCNFEFKENSLDGIDCLYLKKFGLGKYGVVNVVAIYKPPNVSDSTLFNLLNEIIIGRESDLTLIMGDFNIDICDESQNFTNALVEGYGFYQLVNNATHVSGSLLDHVYVYTKSVQAITCKNFPSYYSDHDILQIKMGLN